MDKLDFYKNNSMINAKIEHCQKNILDLYDILLKAKFDNIINTEINEQYQETLKKEISNMKFLLKKFKHYQELLNSDKAIAISTCKGFLPHKFLVYASTADKEKDLQSGAYRNYKTAYKYKVYKGNDLNISKVYAETN